MFGTRRVRSPAIAESPRRPPCAGVEVREQGREQPLEKSVEVDEMFALLAEVRRRLPDVPCPVIGVLSTHSGEGVSTVARALAFVAAQAPRARVVLCDACEGTGEQARAPRLNASIAVETDEFKDGSRHSLARIGGREWHNAVLTHSSTVSAVLMSLCQDADLVIVELPPAKTSQVGPALSRRLDGVLLVVEAERTTSRAAAATCRSVETHGGSIIGAVLNKRRYHIPSSVYRHL